VNQLPHHARRGRPSLDRFQVRPSLAALAVLALIAGCGGGNTSSEAQNETGAAAGSTPRETAMAAAVATPAAADPNAPGKIGNFYVAHTSGDMESAETPISLAYLNDHVAGSKGQIRNFGGKMYAGADRIRLYGLTLYSGATMPSKADALKLASRLRKEGFNAVRMFGWDKELAGNSWAITHKEQGLLNPDQTLNAVALDYFDHWVYQLQQHGIYVMIPMHSSRKYKEAPDCIEYCEGLDNYLPTLIQSQKTFAATFLNHVNPYTGKAYKSDPGVLAIEINNENSLSHRWANGTIDTYLTDPAMYPKYGAPLEAKWRAWAQAKYGTSSAAGQAWGQALASFDGLKAPLKVNRSTLQTQLYKDWAQFTAETESAYHKDMYSYLKDSHHEHAVALHADVCARG
jgi:hypothetical protein